MTPKQIVKELDKYIVGQGEAKKAVAIALRSRWRRMRVQGDIKTDITPRNILMIGPTGVGKTEIARRLASLDKAPFIKVEATKFTEVGYVGRDVESIIRDLVKVAINQEQDFEEECLRPKLREKINEVILDALLPLKTDVNAEDKAAELQKLKVTREKFKTKLLAGELEETQILLDTSIPEPASMPTIMGFSGSPNMEDLEDLGEKISSMFNAKNKNNKNQKEKVAIKDARAIIEQRELNKSLDVTKIKNNALEKVQENGIVFIDEIDKVTGDKNSSANVSREGVQRDLLPLIEGTNVNTKYGIISTNHILFITSGAFHLSKPSDLIPELQGRLPIRVELNSLKTEDFEKILTTTKHSLIKQTKELLATEGLEIDFTKDAIKELAKLATIVNTNNDDIGARRLYTLIEKLMEDISYKAPDLKGEKIKIDKEYVSKQLTHLAKDQNLSQYIL